MNADSRKFLVMRTKTSSRIMLKMFF